ncbi:MAG: hypothetical protein ACLFU7_11675 [Armatimonadota bacterium]
MRAPSTTLMICLAFVALTILPGLADPEFNRYAEFRYTSALPGGGFGVTPDGVPGFEGAMQLNVPVAYTPHRGAVIGYSSASFDSTFHIDTEGAQINGTGIIGIGLGKPGYGLFLVEMPTSIEWEPAQNLQQQIMPEGRKQPAVAVGMQDIFENRDEALGQPHNTDSPYIVATKQWDGAERPVYLTLGYGKGRFDASFFGGVCWRPMDRLTVSAEYDGFNPNASIAYDLSDVLVEDTMLYAGMVDLERAVIGMTYVYSDLEL